jgi:hypothetical protein
MSEFDYIPKGLSFLTKIISTYDVNLVKVLPDSGQTALHPGQKFTVQLPSDGLIDLNSLTMFGEITLTAAAAAYVPPAEMFISQLEVNAGGTQIDRIDYYGDLFYHLNNITSSTAHASNRSMYALESTVTPAAMTGALSGVTITCADATNAAGGAFHTQINAVFDAIRVATSVEIAALGGASAVTAFGAAAAIADTQTGDRSAALIAKVLADQVAAAAAMGLPAAYGNKAIAAAAVTDTTAADVRALVYGQINEYIANVFIMLEQYRQSRGRLVAASGTKKFIINSWLGFLGSNSNHMIDTSLLPKLSVGITLGPNAVMASAAGAAVYSLTAGSVYFTIRRVNFPRFQAALYEAVGEGRVLDYYFSRYVNLIDSMTATTTTHRFTVNSSNIQRIFMAQKPSTYATAAALTSGASVSNYFISPRYDTDNVYWNIGTKQMPQFQIDLSDGRGFYHLLQEIHRNNDSTYDNLIESNWEFHNTKFLHPIAFCYGYERDVISGIDTMAGDRAITFNQGTAGGASAAGGYKLFMVQATANLQVMAGKMLHLSP